MYPLIQTFLVYKSRQKWSKFKAIVSRWAMRWCSTTELVLGTFFPWDPSLPQSFTISSAVHSLKCSFCTFVLLQISIDTCFSTNKIAFRPKKFLGSRPAGFFDLGARCTVALGGPIVPSPFESVLQNYVSAPFLVDTTSIFGVVVV